jgi:hypothetical protein
MIFAVPSLTARIPAAAAKQQLAASSGAPVASSYERALRPGELRFSPSRNAICSGGDR